MKYLFYLLSLTLVTVSPVLGQATPTISESDRAAYEELRNGGHAALYDFDYDKALKNFKELDRRFPNHPAGPQLLAARVWIKTLYESRRLQSSLYSSENFYSSGDDKVDPKVVNEFRALTREARRRAEVLLKQNPKDVESLYWLGAVEGLKASFEEAVERRHFAALRNGNDAVEHHRQVLKLDPTFTDASLTIGLYEYVVGSLPLPIKVVAGITGFRGSKKRGLEMLERLAQGPSWASGDARSLLILLYNREKKFVDSLRHARAQSVKYPRNYLFKLEAAGALVAQAELERKAKNTAAATSAEREAFGIFDDLLRDRSARNPISRVLDLVHFKYGEVLLTAGEGDRASKEFIAATKVDQADPALVTMAHLYAARAFDLAGRRSDALVQYRQVLTRPDIYAAHDAAKKGLREPYKTEFNGL